MRKENKHINNLLILLFLIILVVPSFFQITRLEDRIAHSENRELKAFPTFDKNKPLLFLRQFKAYYKDNFGLRYTLSNIYLRFKFKVLNESPIPSKVVVGKNGFLYLGNSFSDVLSESLGFKLFTKSELNQIKFNIEERKNWLDSQNIGFYVCIIPNKHTIYREYLPVHFPYQETRKDQLVDFVKRETDIEIIDVEKLLKSKKQKLRIYHKLDSHWNDLGAFFGSQFIVNVIKKDYPIDNLSLDSFKIDFLSIEGSTSKMLGLSDTENQIYLKPFFDDKTIKLETNMFYKNKSINELRYKNPDKPFKVLVFRDSFTTALIPFFNQTFGECTYIWSHDFDKELIQQEKPDIVIMEYVERYIERM